MTVVDEPGLSPLHTLNNLMGKIIGAAEIGLDQVEGRRVRAELEAVIRLAETAAAVVREAAATGRLR